MRTVTIARTLGLVLAAGGLLLTSACGGSTTEAAVNDNGEVVTLDNGEAVNEEAHNRWTAALAQFLQFEEQGWNADKCTSSTSDFESANSAQGGTFTEAIYMAGLSASRCNRNDAARDFYNAALATNESFCKARSALGVMQMDAGQEQPAFQTFERAIRDDPRCTEGYVNLATIQRTRGGAENIRESLNNLRRGLAIDSNYLPAFNQMALLYLDLARATDNDQRLDLAGVVCRQAQLIDRDYAPIYNTWGLVFVRQGNIIEAIRMFERATRLDGTMYEAHMNFAQITISFRGYEDARASFARAVELQPNSYDAHVGLGAALRGLNQMPRAQAQYERAAEMDPARPEAFFNLGILFQDYRTGTIEDLAQAKQYYQQFLTKAGQNERYSEAREAVSRRCEQQNSRRRRRRSTDCRPGRMQNIDTALDALREAAAMQAGN